MSDALYEETDNRPTPIEARRRVRSESALRVAAAMLSHTRSGEVKATTVVCDVPDSDLRTFETLVAAIASGCGLQAEIRYRNRTSAVCFTRPPAAQAGRGRVTQA